MDSMSVWIYQEVRVGTVCSVPGWIIKFLRILGMAKHFRTGWAIAIQNIQSYLGLQRTAFPDLCLEGDYVFCYDLSKQMELEDLDNELWLKEYKKKRRAHIQEIVDASMLSEQEKEWMKEYASQSAKDITYGKENRHVERIIMPNFFDKRRNDHM